MTNDETVEYLLTKSGLSKELVDPIRSELLELIRLSRREGKADFAMKLCGVED